ncbi:MAG: ATP-dependent DNA helicase RecG [Erysipelotrichaceae bacterium]|nr:ATP-dependent DNA helicase RecG [Erysipelotrichaceae bacterium]
MKEIKLTAKQKEAFEALGIEDTKALLTYYPYRYETLSYLPFEQWQTDSRVIIEGRIVGRPRFNYFKSRNSVLYLNVEDQYNQYRVTIFNRPWLRKLSDGENITVIGRYEGNLKILAFQITNVPMNEMLGIHPVYSLKDKINEKTFIKLMNKALEENSDQINDFIPTAYLEKYGYYHKYDALRNIHQPKSESELVKALDTMKYEEFIRFNLLMLGRRKENFISDSRFAKQFDPNDIKNFIDGLPFRLTEDQLQAVREITRDLQSEKQMSRLLQGDVGTGKTIVGFIAMYETALAGKQSALMAPTEILARQHYNNLLKIFEPLGIRCGLLISAQTTQERKEILNGLASGDIQMAVGTHALFQNDVEYHDLGLVISDEQQRFGVRQRAALMAKGSYCDILMMSATPIPRTLATTLYGDIDVSTITQSPNSGKEIETKLIRGNSFMPVLDEIEEFLKQGNQMYVICPSIENSESSRNASDIYVNLKKYFAGRYRVDLLHGQMAESEKEEVEQAFKKGDVRILVCTTVVEVGVDVHDANIMVIYNANRFGLSQLHQLRGRIGRGDRKGYCYLLSDSDDPQALEKLEVIVNNTDGFKISYYDLKLRGPGDVMGLRQSGLPQFELANIINDSSILINAKNDAMELMNELDSWPQLGEYVKENLDNDIIRA